jgi:3',5'-cyclic AMP phosphodiesterase CpdA
MGKVQFRIAQISDTHISPHGHFVEQTFDWAANDINGIDPAPDIVIHSGDLTDNGVLTEYELAVKKLRMLKPKLLVAPGNHDEKNYGNSLFKEMIGPVDSDLRMRDIVIYITDSPQPDRDEGRLGRRRQTYLEEKLSQLGREAVKIIVFHHHLVSVPFSGRDQDVLEDAGDILDMVLRHKVNLVLMGHRHVRRALQIYDTVLVNAGTTSSIRTRGRLGHSYNLIDIFEDGSIKVAERSITERKTTILGTFTPRSVQEKPVAVAT